MADKIGAIMLGEEKAGQKDPVLRDVYVLQDADQERYLSYMDKNRELTEVYGEPLDEKDFYMELFNDGVALQSREGDHDGKANLIVVSKEDHGAGKEKRFTIHPDNRFEELDQIGKDEFAFMSAISYFGKSRTLKNARFMYAMPIDLDGVGMKQLGNLIAQIDNEVIPRPTYIANSGTGLHLYYKFETPVPMYPAMQQALKELKKALTRWVWNVYTSYDKKIQFQSINQGFRLVGGETKELIVLHDKNNTEVNITATVLVWRTGKPVTLSYIEGFLHAVDIDFDSIGKYSSKHTLEECKEKFPEWYQKRIIDKEPPGKWTVKRDLYDWWIRQVEENGSMGHRYWCLYALVAYAIKCDVPYDQLKKDAARLQPILNEKGKDPFTKKDMRDALRLYKDKALASKLTRHYIEEQTAIQMPANKRNYQKQKDHLEEARAIRDIRQRRQGKEWNGRKPKEDIVRAWQDLHPGGKKIECHRDTGLSRVTIDKWWQK